jgi:hypothetical protein
MREKYIDAAVGGVWFIFGKREDGSVDISNGTTDVFTKVPLEKALNLLAIRSKFLQELYRELK